MNSPRTPMPKQLAMNSPRSMSGVFVSGIPEPKKRRPKAPNSCYPTQARGREEISRSYCASPGVPGMLRSPREGMLRSPREASPVPPALPQALMRTLQPGQSPSSPAMMTAASQSRIPRPRLRSINGKSSDEAAKTISAIDGALHAVQAIMMKSKLASNDSSPSASEDLESLCGTECTESTACSSSLSEADGGSSRGFCYSLGSSIGFSLKDARRTLKERIGAEERSMRFTNGLLTKLDELRDALAEETGSPMAKTPRARPAGLTASR